MKKQLRSGFTTGACAAAAAKAATVLLLSGRAVREVEITLPNGSRVAFQVKHNRFTPEGVASATIVKDAGDDPDVTDGAEIVARVHCGAELNANSTVVGVTGGIGVGTVTKPGLPVGVGKPAINPIPLQLIKDSVVEAAAEAVPDCRRELLVTISVPDGVRLAEKTLNGRLGIIGGISILGTTGIVKPVSVEAWTATISAALKVAAANRCQEVILATGRTSERVVSEALQLPQEAVITMGDYLAFALGESGTHGFKRIHLATMWGKLLKGALGTPQTHVRHGSIELDRVLIFMENQGVEAEVRALIDGSNTAREILDRLLEAGNRSVLELVCKLACERYYRLAGTPVTVHLVHGSGTILHSVTRDG